jgi:hypothetical protein
MPSSSVVAPRHNLELLFCMARNHTVSFAAVHWPCSLPRSRAQASMLHSCHREELHAGIYPIICFEVIC